MNIYYHCLLIHLLLNQHSLSYIISFQQKTFAAAMSTSEEQNLIDNICNTDVIIINNQTDNLAKSTHNSTAKGTVYQFPNF